MSALARAFSEAGLTPGENGLWLDERREVGGVATEAGATPVAFEDRVRGLTRPLNGQYPRPWMTDLTDPLSARVFVVGRNQATGIPEDSIAHGDYVDALFNRNGRSCRGLYEHVRARAGKGPSLTRRNTDALVERLRARGVDAVLETNVICYSTPMSADLAAREHAGGRALGTEIFRFLLGAIRPEVLLVHGSGTGTDLGRLLGLELPPPPRAPAPPPERQWRDTATILVLPALSPPAWNRWASWAAEYFEELADTVAARLSSA